jgi:hypothetical protein
MTFAQLTRRWGIALGICACALILSAASTQAGPRALRSSRNVQVELPDGFDPTADSLVRPREILAPDVEVEGVFQAASASRDPFPPTFVFAFVPAPSAEDAETSRSQLEDRLRGEAAAPTVSSSGRSRIRALRGTAAAPIEYRAELLVLPEGVAVALFVVAPPDVPPFESRIEATLRSLRGPPPRGRGAGCRPATTR